MRASVATDFNVWFIKTPEQADMIEQCRINSDRFGIAVCAQGKWWSGDPIPNTASA
jgi:hypothetical protein